MAEDVVLNEELLVPFEDGDRLPEPVDVLETEIERDVVGEVVPVLEEVVVAVAVVDCDEVLETLVDPDTVDVDVEVRVLDTLCVEVRVLNIEPVEVVDPD